MNQNYTNSSPYSQDPSQLPPQPSWFNEMPWSDEMMEAPGLQDPTDFIPPEAPNPYAWHVNDQPKQSKQYPPINSADFIVPDDKPAELQPKEQDEECSDKRQYITTHTPHVWLDRYIEYSRDLSPRGFNALHEAAGLWVMSSVVAGRVQTFFGGRLRHTSLMFTAIARSSVWVKSHTIGGSQIAIRCGARLATPSHESKPTSHYRRNGK